MVPRRAGAAVPGGREILGMGEVVLAMALAGSSVVAGKVLSAGVPVFLSAELGLAAALIAILPAQLARRRELRLLGRRDLGWMFLQALFGMVLFRVFTLYGLRWTTAATAGLITSAAPAVMTAVAALVLRERMGPRGFLAVALAMAGLLLINGQAAGTPAARGVLGGNLLVLAATVCEALLTVFRKRSGGGIGSVTNTTILVAMSAVMLLPFALRDLRGFPLSRIDAAGWLAVGYYGAVATSIAYVLWGDGSLRIPAARTGIAMAAMPLSAMALSAVVLGEKLGPLHLIGGAAVAAAIVVGRK